MQMNECQPAQIQQSATKINLPSTPLFNEIITKLFLSPLKGD
jgi:hypothetical protein